MIKKLACALVAACCLTGVSRADWFDDGQSIAYQNALKGKKVVFVPLGTSFDIVQAWLAKMNEQAKERGYELSVRDPNWDPNVGAQIMTGLLQEKPDLIVVANANMQAYSRILKQAIASDINILQVNMKSTTTTDAYVGADWYEAGVKSAEPIVEACSTSKGKSGKVALIQGQITAPASFVGLKGAQDVIAKHPDIQIVASQAADWDAGKAHSITSTILKQHPDLCGIIGFWDAMDVGTAAAIREAGLQGKVYLATQGGGAKIGCESVANGTFTYYVTYQADLQANEINDAIKVLLQTKPKAASNPFAIYTPLKVLDKENLKSTSCWSLDDLN